MSVTLSTPVPSVGDGTTRVGAAQLAPVVTLVPRRATAVDRGVDRGADTVSVGHDLPETGAASAEYAAVTACGVGLAGVLMKLLSSDFGQNLLETVLKFFLGLVGIG